MDDATSNIHDWEVVLQEEEDGEFITKSSSSSVTSGGVIQSDYFTLDSHHRDYVGGGDAPAAAAVSESSSVDSDNPSWVDPSGSSVGRRRGRSPDSNFSSSDSSTADQHNLLSLIQPHSGCGCGAHHDFNIPNEPGMSSSDQSFTEEFHDAAQGEQGQQQRGVVEDDEDSQFRTEEERERESERQVKEEKRVVWWKVPMEVLRYCVMRVGPVWSLSMVAAAVMGLVILRKRYMYNLKRKAQGIQLKLTVDDKKVSQFTTRAARLNEAFSVVKRVPIIRPALPAPGMVPWLVVSMR